jgi:excisionase family DNA binding protein
VLNALAFDLPEAGELAPTETDRRLANEGRRVLAGYLSGNRKGTLKLVDDGVETEISVPEAALRRLDEILSHISRGQSVIILPLDIELTTQQAAALLNVSPPYLTSLLEDEKAIPFRSVGKHRWIRLLDLLAYKRKFLEEREAVLRELAAQAQELGMGYE